jgi:SpoVK/Ycf46/Vps4 family AAA+-type ATPase
MNIIADNLIPWINIPNELSIKNSLIEGELYLIEDKNKFIDTISINNEIIEIKVPTKILGFYNLEKIEKINFSVIQDPKIVEYLEIEILTNFEGVNIQEARKQIKNKTYFTHNEIFEIFINNNKYQAKVVSNHSNIMQANKQSRIKLLGKGIVGISDIGGQQELINWYKDDYLFSLKAKNYLDKWGLKTPRGLLLSGKPGLGKTYFLKAMVADSGVYYINISAPDIITPLAGDGDKILEEKFDEARENSPAIICIDEVDALCLNRSSSNQNYENRVVTVLLKEMDGVETRGDVLVIGTTNRPEAIDKAFLRPGRFTYQIELNYPSKDDRIKIFQTHLKKITHSLTEINLTELADKTNGYSGAEIESVVHKVSIQCIRTCINENNTDSPILDISLFDNFFNNIK